MKYVLFAILCALSVLLFVREMFGRRKLTFFTVAVQVSYTFIADALTLVPIVVISSKHFDISKQIH